MLGRDSLGINLHLVLELLLLLRVPVRVLVLPPPLRVVRLLLDTGPLWDSEARPKWYRVNPNLYYLTDHDQRSLSSNVV